MDPTANTQLCSDICEISHEDLTQVAGGVIDDGHTPVRTYTPGRLTPEDNEDHQMAGAALFGDTRYP